MESMSLAYMDIFFVSLVVVIFEDCRVYAGSFLKEKRNVCQFRSLRRSIALVATAFLGYIVLSK